MTSGFSEMDNPVFIYYSVEQNPEKVSLFIIAYHFLNPWTQNQHTTQRNQRDPLAPLDLNIMKYVLNIIMMMMKKGGWGVGRVQFQCPGIGSEQSGQVPWLINMLLILYPERSTKVFPHPGHRV